MTGASEQKYELLSDSAFLEELRLQMVKFSMLQLGDIHQAEDAVQEALIGAMKNAKSFGGRAALKTWVFAILKYKIADTLRQKYRTVNATSLLGEDEEEILPGLFDQRGFWQADERPVSWGDPESALHEEQFWKVFETCLDRLPPKQARVFMMREFIGLDPEEICSEIGLSTSNLYVLLHRSRIRLRECMETKWYVEGEKHAELS